MRERSSPRRNRRLEVVSSKAAAEAQPSWRLPSGIGLAEFALRGGFLMPALMESTRDRQPGEAAGTNPGDMAFGGKA